MRKFSLTLAAKISGSILGLALVVTSGLARADVIVGPAMPQFGFTSGWSVTGLEFKALTDSTLTGFTFTNQGKADNVVLTDITGNILQQISTPAGTFSTFGVATPVSVNWSLTSGNSYWLLQTTLNNGWRRNLSSNPPFVLPSNSDIAILHAGSFDTTIAGAVNGGRGCLGGDTQPPCPPNNFWADFNNLTTVPIPGPIAGAGLPGLMFGGAAFLAWWRRRYLRNSLFAAEAGVTTEKIS
jgi:hypothetical protein